MPIIKRMTTFARTTAHRRKETRFVLARGLRLRRRRADFRFGGDAALLFRRRLRRDASTCALGAPTRARIC